MDKKNTLLLTVIAIATLLVAIVGATFAYFTAQTGAGQDVKIDVTTSTSDSSSFNVTQNIKLNATQANFGESSTGVGAHSLSASGYGVVSLIANNNTKKGALCYRAGLIVDTNTFIYSLPKTNDKQGSKTDYYPELLLRVWKQSESGKAVHELQEDGIDSVTFAAKDEYGNSDGESTATSLHTITGTDTAALKSGTPEEDITVPYKSSDDIKSTVKKICPDSVLNEDAGESCTEITDLSGYDITMLGFTRGVGTNQATQSFTDPELNNIIGKKIILIPPKATDKKGTDEYAHKIEISSASADQNSLTAADYWKVTLTFVNYSDADIEAPGEGKGTTTEQWSAAHGNSVHYADQNNNTGKTFSAKFRFEPIDASQCPLPA